MGPLYTCAQSRGLRVTWTLEEMNLPCEVISLPFPPRIKAPEFLGFNPLGTVPAFVDEGALMTESSAIVQYLVTRHGPSELSVSCEEDDYGMFLDWLHHADATLTFPQTVYIRFARFEAERGLQAAGEAYADWFIARLAKLEHHLGSREYLCASRFTGADIAVGYALYLTMLNGLAPRLPPAVRAYLDRLIERPAFQRARDREKAAPVHTGRFAVLR